MTDPLSPALAGLTDDELREQLAVHVGLRDIYAQDRPHVAALHAAIAARLVRERNRRRREVRELERAYRDGAPPAWWGDADVC